MIKISKSIPAEEWMKAKTQEDRDALIEKYTEVITDAEKIAQFEKERLEASAESEDVKREKGIQALARKKLEEEYDALSDVQKEKLLK